MWSCAPEPPVEKLYIHGFTCGDSIDSRISIGHMNHRPPYIEYGEFRDDSRIRLVLIHGNIWKIMFDSITYIEADSLSRRIVEVYQKAPIISYSEGQTAVRWEWNDSIWSDKLVLSKLYGNNPDSLFSLYFEKPLISNWMIR